MVGLFQRLTDLSALYSLTVNVPEGGLRRTALLEALMVRIEDPELERLVGAAVPIYMRS